MTQEDKELLLKDLCARLPYEVKALDREEKITIKAYIRNLVIDEVGISHSIDDCKPYLFPLSSMTEEQQIELTKFVANGISGENIVYDWYNKNHFDYRGLIPKGLAIDATGLNIY